MLVVLPTHNGDRNLALNLCEHIARLGGTKNHEVLLVAPHDANLGNMEEILRGSFGRFHMLRYAETMRGWPYGANEAAAIAMLHIFENPDLRYHYLMLEPDCVPTTPFWLDMLDMDYRRCGQSVLGVRIPTVEIATNRQVGNHVVGVAIYPNNFPQLCPLVRYCVDMTRQHLMQKSMPMPWDAYFGPYTSKMVAETSLIQHLPRQRFEENGVIKWDCPSLDFALQQANRQAVLVHGSKHAEFLSRLTGAPSQPTTTHATEIRKEPDTSEHPGDAQGQTVCESSPIQGETSCQPDGGGGGNPRLEKTLSVIKKSKDEEVDNYVPNPKVLARQRREREELRKELGISFDIDTPHFRRAAYYHTGPKWTEIRSHATENGIKIFKKTKGEIINALVELEAEQMKEEWTKVLKAAPVSKPEPLPPVVPVEEAPPVPVGSTPVSRSGGMVVALNIQGGYVDDKGNAVQTSQNTLSEERQQQMRKMLADRQLLNH